MRVLLINTNLEVNPWPVVPLGLCYLASTLEHAGYEVRLLDLTFGHRRERRLRQIIQSFRPDCIGISIRNIDNVNMCQPFFYLDAIKTNIVDMCRETSSAPLLLGGSAIGIAPEEILDFLAADYAIAGDGEQPVLALLEQLQNNNGGCAQPTAGVYARDRMGQIISPPELSRCNLADLVHPEPYRWIDYRLYEKRGATANIQAKRGCAFQCIYCSYNLIEGKHYRLREPSDIADEVEKWVRHAHPRCLEFVDSTFNAPQHHALAICEELVRKNLKMRYTTMGLNPGCLSDDLMIAMKAAGFDQFMCSPDSASQTVLERLHKNFDRTDLEKAVKLFQKHDLRTFWFFVLGGPGETTATLEDTLDFCQNSIDPRDVIHLTIGFRVFGQTELARIMRREGLLTDGQSLLRPTFYVSPHVNARDILSRIHARGRKQTNIITYFDMELYDTLKYLTETFFPINTPEHNWVHIPNINRQLNRLGIWSHLHRRHQKRLNRLHQNTSLPDMPN
ncbi:radical SAM protein [bacterium]|nr:radical SAM protein [bacterium]